MSIVAALKKKGNVWVVADRQTSWSHTVRNDFPSAGKLVPFKNAYIGHTGLCVFGTALRYLAETDKTMFEHPFDTRWDVLNFFFEYHKFLKHKFDMGDAKSNEVSRMSDSEFVVVTPKRIYEVADNRDITEFDTFTCIGSGHLITLGAIQALSNHLDDPADILKQAYDICCHYNRTCGGDMELINVTKELKKK